MELSKPIHKIRRHNFNLLLDQHRTQEALGAAIKKKGAYVGQLSRQPKADVGGWRNMGEDVARDIERMLSLEPGWMDVDRRKGSAAFDNRIAEKDTETEYLSDASIALQKRILKMQQADPEKVKFVLEQMEIYDRYIKPRGRNND